ncbi:MAG: hypothetical protein B6244_10625 [Candidatus Cloacimonetes bacterium 4572_55]|nr:MAG: hypothetical protein B6244_10625 [Candidatus Cloacimonetes bacterium 4572_55]
MMSVEKKKKKLPGDPFRYRKLFIKMIFSFLAVTFVPLLFLYFLLIKTTGELPFSFEEIGLNLAHQKVNSDLNTARLTFQSKRQQLRVRLVEASRHPRLIQAIQNYNEDKVNNLLDAFRTEEDFHFLQVIERKGTLLSATNLGRTSGPDETELNYSQHPIVQLALGGEIGLSVRTEDQEWLARLGVANQARTVTKLGEGDPYPIDYAALTDGMVIEVSAPVIGKSGQVIAVLFGGHLINNSDSLIHEIEKSCFAEKGTGSVSIYLGPVTVATNIVDEDGVRATGAVIQREEGIRVLERAEKWLGDTKILGERYLSAYEPIIDHNNRVIGVLHIGTKKKPFIQSYLAQGELIASNLIRSFWRNALMSMLFAFIVAFVFARKLTHLIRQMVLHTQSIADGDLTSKLHIHQRDEIGQLAYSINRMTGKLRYLVNEIKNAGVMVKEHSQRISDSINILATTTSQQSAATDQTTATMEEVAVSSRQIAENSNFVAETALTTQKNAQKGVDAISDTLDKMNEVWKRNDRNIQEIISLGSKSKEIGDVMETIKLIADQTKLIAFNAAIESSGESEAERRFSIVAVEIRRLADSVMQSTEEIRDRIEEIQEATYELVISSEEGTKKLADGLDHTRVTANLLQEILEAANMTAESARRISLATQQQKTASEQVVIALQEIFDGTKQLVETNNTSIGISAYLQELSEELGKTIQKFKID